VSWYAFQAERRKRRNSSGSPAPLGDLVLEERRCRAKVDEVDAVLGHLEPVCQSDDDALLIDEGELALGEHCHVDVRVGARAVPCRGAEAHDQMERRRAGIGGHAWKDNAAPQPSLRSTWPSFRACSARTVASVSASSARLSGR
jgi:hypothetical protein